MIGLIGEALNDDIIVDPKELETARWFERDEVQSMLDKTHPQGLNAPLPLAIAHHLIRACLHFNLARLLSAGDSPCRKRASRPERAPFSGQILPR